jgi:hypothetical protein
VVVDRVGADEQLGGDLLVGGTVGREAGDLCFLGGQVVARLDGPFARMFAGCFELDPGAFGERFHAELREQFVGGAELLARVAPAALAAQPFAVEEIGARELDPYAGPLEPLDRLAIERLGRFAFGQ